MNITVIGTGYVGLVTAAVFSKLGNKVFGLDIDKIKIKKLKKGQVPFYEPGLDNLVLSGVKKGRLVFTDSYKKALEKTEVVFICVGTPAKEDGDYNLQYVFDSAKSIAQNLKKYAVICIKSTVPPSTTDQVKKIILGYTDIKFDMASCPEFLREGSAVADALKPSRVVIGTNKKKAKDILIKLHKPLKAPRVYSDIKSAQLIKYAANAMLATKISYINSIARICDQIGADIKIVEKGLGLDPRIGKYFLEAGLGYGGSCFPKDTWALIAYAKRLGYDFKFLKEVDNVNDSQIEYVYEKIKELCGGSVKNKKIAVLGLAFKPDTDDIRESRSIELIVLLNIHGAKVFCFDPQALNNAKKVLKEVEFAKNEYQALDKAEVMVLATKWPQFNKLNFKKAAKIMKEKNIVDARNFFDKEKLEKLGFNYRGVGR
jgi:UDPglucose 6-dehydrogenase